MLCVYGAIFKALLYFLLLLSVISMLLHNDDFVFSVSRRHKDTKIPRQ